MPIKFKNHKIKYEKYTFSDKDVKTIDGISVILGTGLAIASIIYGIILLHDISKYEHYSKIFLIECLGSLLICGSIGFGAEAASIIFISMFVIIEICITIYDIAYEIYKYALKKLNKPTNIWTQVNDKNENNILIHVNDQNKNKFSVKDVKYNINENKYLINITIGDVLNNDTNNDIINILHNKTISDNENENLYNIILENKNSLNENNLDSNV
jgi:hypothetical protein